jgi:hypothetical protein
MKKVLSTREITQLVNDKRLRMGRDSVKESWIVTICRNKDSRRARGLPWLPAHRIEISGNSKNSRSRAMLQYVVISDDITDELLEAIASLEPLSLPKANPKKPVSALDLIKGKEIDVRDIDAIRKVVDADRKREAEEVYLKMLSHNIKIREVATSLRNHDICGFCRGEGCPDCIGGVVPLNRPRYEDGRIFKVADWVSIQPIDDLPSAALGYVLFFDAESVTVRLCESDMRPLKWVAEYKPSEVDFVRRNITQDF